MAEDNIDKKREEARRAMSAGRLSSVNNSAVETLSTVALTDDTITATDREEAKMAMANKSKQAQHIVEQEEIEKKRIDAARAMEGSDRKKRREEEERKKLEIDQRNQNIENVKKKRLLVEKKLELEKLERLTKLNTEEQQEGDTYREQVIGAKKKIAELAKSDSDLPEFHDPNIDLQATGNQEQISKARLAIQDRQKQLRSEAGEYKKNRKSFALSAFSWLVVIILVAGSLGVLSYATILLRGKIAGVEVLKKNSLIFTEFQEKVTVNNQTPDAIRLLLLKSGQKNATADSLTDVYFTKTITTDTGTSEEVITTADFLAITNTTFAPDFLHFLEPQFMAGVYTRTFVDKTVVFIFKTRSFEHSFDTMLRGGGKTITSLYGELLSQTDKNLIETKSFSDTTIDNTNIRYIKNDNEETIMMYGFLDRETLVFAKNEEAFLKILASFRRPKSAL